VGGGTKTGKRTNRGDFHDSAQDFKTEMIGGCRLNVRVHCRSPILHDRNKTTGVLHLIGLLRGRMHFYSEDNIKISSFSTRSLAALCSRRKFREDTGEAHADAGRSASLSRCLICCHAHENGAS
jgi:hypothetical protein